MRRYRPKPKSRLGLAVHEGRFDGYRLYLRNTRIIKGFTQQDVAEIIRCDRGTIAHYERGSREPSYEILKSLSKLYGEPDFSRLLEIYTYKDGQFVGDLGNIEIGIQ